jgi:hypothetical protein
MISKTVIFTKTEIIDNFLDKKIHEEIKKNMFGGNFPWYYTPMITTQEEQNDFMFTHTFYRENQILSNYFCNLAMPIIGNMKYNYLLRIKANLYTKKNENIFHGFHTDFCEPHKVALYSVNTNNGFTEFENGEKFYSVENRLIIFDGRIKHRSVTQTDENLRINININVI